MQQIEEWLWNAIAYDFTLAYAEMLWAHNGAFLTAVTLAPEATPALLLRSTGACADRPSGTCVPCQPGRRVRSTANHPRGINQ